jgi:hypothetical protein
MQTTHKETRKLPIGPALIPDGTNWKAPAVRDSLAQDLAA